MMKGNYDIHKGDILISEPFMLDPNFKRSVVLLCDHSEEEGSIGFILNKPINMKINELIGDFPDVEFNVNFGGPVATDTIHYVHNVGEILDESIEILRGVYWGGNFEKMKFLVESELILPHNIRFFVGYSGWSAGQLKEELQIGSWVKDEMHPNYAFKSSPQSLWSQVLEHKGDTFAVIAQMPDSFSYN